MECTYVNTIAKYIPGVIILMGKLGMGIMRTLTTINCSQISSRNKRKNKNNCFRQLYHIFVRCRIVI